MCSPRFIFCLQYFGYCVNQQKCIKLLLIMQYLILNFNFLFKAKMLCKIYLTCFKSEMQRFLPLFPTPLSLPLPLSASPLTVSLPTYSRAPQLCHLHLKAHADTNTHPSNNRMKYYNSDFRLTRKTFCFSFVMWFLCS